MGLYYSQFCIMKNTILAVGGRTCIPDCGPPKSWGHCISDSRQGTGGRHKPAAQTRNAHMEKHQVPLFRSQQDGDEGVQAAPKLGTTHGIQPGCGFQHRCPLQALLYVPTTFTGFFTVSQWEKAPIPPKPVMLPDSIKGIHYSGLKVN